MCRVQIGTDGFAKMFSTSICTNVVLNVTGVAEIDPILSLFLSVLKYKFYELVNA